IPGVPDFYQGAEDWDFSLVDPDNRRPVDFAARERALGDAGWPDWRVLAEHWTDGRIKLSLTHRLLMLRQTFPALLRDGGYEPIEVTGPHRDHVVAFSRTWRRERIVVAVGRHFAALTADGTHWAAGWQARLVAGKARLFDALDTAHGECRDTD